MERAYCRGEGLSTRIFVFLPFGDGVGKQGVRTPRMRLYRIPPESWQIVGKWLSKRGSVKQKKWKSPHKPLEKTLRRVIREELRRAS